MWLAVAGGFSHFGVGYYLMFYLPKILPITLMGIYLIFRTNKPLNIFSYICFILALIAVPFFIINDTLKIPMNIYFQEYNWNYPAIIEWAGAFALCYLTSFIKTKDGFFSMVFSTQTIVLGGYIYELTIGSGQLFSIYYPFYIATALFSFASIIYLSLEKHWNITKLTLLLLIPFISYLIFYPTNIYYSIWLPRIPTILLLSTLPLGFKALTPNRKA